MENSVDYVFGILYEKFENNEIDKLISMANSGQFSLSSSSEYLIGNCYKIKKEEEKMVEHYKKSIDLDNEAMGSICALCDYYNSKEDSSNMSKYAELALNNKKINEDTRQEISKICQTEKAVTQN